ncbi:LacI family DNA-binding transcriptional regulator [Georgenia subflava]|uniref:Substrate-binding domain-containing protein n=1 Tax=Georgenia subflava TaxID=1622177 RepID=A0A6N7EEJ9_9MICO|nr:LacI family DNA-binding transcriptional regulator [Georgenia subflava]MPV36450.1 substrate-binding domain-containing protein [Georgenia subflava]
MKRATIYSIAQELDISASTVSRAFSKPELVKESVRERILATAQRLGYEPNRAARGLATGRTGLIGLLIPDITNPFFPPLVRAIEQAAAGAGAEVLLVDSGASGSNEPGLIGRIKAQVDGLIVASPRMATAGLKRAVAGVPTVVVNRAVQGLPTVVCDNSGALREAAEHLYSRGHRKVVLLRGPGAAWAAGRRAQAVRRWAEGRDVELVELGPLEAQFEDGRAAVGELVGSGATAIFAFDDLMACGVIAGLSEHSLRVPADCSVVGCDDVLLARTVTPSLSTVTAPVEELGGRAVEMLSRVVAGETVKDEVVTGTLTLRGTTGDAPRS